MSNNIYNNKQKDDGNLILTPDEPFAGLASFTEENKPYFKGRDKEVAKILSRLEDKILTVIYGKSGIGKSSIIRAGVFPELRSKLYLPIDIKWDLLMHSASSNQLTDLIINLIKDELEKNNIDTVTDSVYKKFIEQNSDVIHNLKGSDKLWFYLNTSCFWDEKNNIVIPVILFDQFERIFKTSNEEEFFLFLQKTVEIRYPEQLIKQEFHHFFNESKTKFKLIIALEESFLPELTMYEKEIPTLLRNKYRLTPFNVIKANEAIMLPSKESQIITEDTASEIINYLAETDESTREKKYIQTSFSETIEIEPILLSVVCKKLNDERKKENAKQVTINLIKKWTEKNKLLNDFYNDILNEIISDEKLKKDLKIVIEDNLLTETGELDFADEDTMIQKLSSFFGSEQDLLNQLIRKRILRREPFLGRQRIYIIHNKLAKAIAAEKNERLTEEKRTENDRKAKFEKEEAEKQLAYEKQARKSFELEQKLILEKERADKNEIKRKLIIEESNKQLFQTKKKQATVILIIITIVIVLCSALLFNNIISKKNLANRYIEKAKGDSLNAAIYANNLKMKADSALERAENASVAAEIARDKANSFQKVAEVAKIRAEIYASKLIDEAKNRVKAQQRADSISLQEIITRQYNNALQIEVFKNQIEKDFRNRNINNSDMDSNLFKKASDELLVLKLSNKGNEIEYTNLLNAIDSVLQAKIYILSNTDQGKGLTIAFNIWKNSNNKLIDSILRTFINRSLYYKQQVSPHFSDDASSYSNYNANATNTLLAFSKKNNTLYFDLNNRTYVAKLYNDSIVDIKSSLSIDSLYKRRFVYYNSRLNTLTYNPTTDNVSGLLNLKTGTKIFIWNITQGLKILKEFNIGYFSRYYISPNQKYLISYDGLYKLWKIDDLRNKKHGKNDYNLFPKNQSFAKTVTFSDDSKKVAFLNDDNTISVYELDNETLAKIKYDINPSFITANFVFNGQAIAGYTTKSSNNRIYIRYLQGENALKNPTFININDTSILNVLRSANQLSISTTGKTLLLNSSSGVVVCKLSGTYSFFDNIIDSRDINFKKLTIQNNLNACLINDSLVMSINANLKIYLWKIYPDFNNLNDFFSAVKLPANNDIITKSNNATDLRNNAAFYYDKYFSTDEKPDSSDLNIAAALYHKLFLLDTINRHFYISKLFSAYEQLTLIDTKLQNSESYFNILISAAKMNKNFNYYLRSLSSFYGSASWYQIKVSNPKLALAYAKYGIRADSTNDFVYTNLALGYLLSHDFTNAEKVYDSLKDVNYRYGVKSFKKAFTEDFKDLIDIGVINEANREIWEEVKKIKIQILKVQ